ncbi:MAG TPA: T9SS type A sorting domain-containing protein [Chitinophagales bacterium]|nr:T9SS type A sorting domain-containing protein [Chitinophagales bacterium]
MKNLLLLLCFFSITAFTRAQIPQLWGTMSIGGPFGVGTIIKVNGDGTGFGKVYSFSTGSPQCNLLPSGNSIIYGVTVSGGTHALGEIFSYNSSTNTFASLYSMDSSQGFYPRGSLVMAANNKLYGMTSNGGAFNLGVLFSFDPSNNTYVKLHEFDNTTGQFPNGSVIQAANGKLYGMTSTGGLNGGGIIFSYDIANNVFTDVHDFDFSTGSITFGSLLEAGNGLLYGMAFGGGTTGHGVIFSFDPANNNYTVIHNFNGTDGSAPFAGLTEAANGLLYGNTSQGGANSGGIIFSIDPVGTGFTKLHDFEDATGSKPWGGLMQASDGNLYGMTAFGGVNGLGAIFSYNLSSDIYTKLHDGDFTDGALPYAGFIEYKSITGIGDVDADIAGVKIYPNPSDGNVTIEMADKYPDGITYTIFNMLGEMLETRALTKNVSELWLDYEPGVYMIAVTSGNNSVTRKMVIR